MPKKIIKWSLIALLVFFVVTQPDNAAGTVRSITDGLQNVAEGFSEFVTGIV